MASAERRIFILGMNKCGTRSLHKFFRESDLPSIHHDEGRLARRIDENVLSGRPPIEGYDEFQVFSDMEVTIDESRPRELILAQRYFREFDAAYPGSLFILNTRNIDNWIVSRFNHGSGAYPKIYLEKLRRRDNDQSLDMVQLVEAWRADWNELHGSIREYFTDHDRFLEYHIENDSSEKLVAFLESHSIQLKSKTLPHRGQSDRAKARRSRRRWYSRLFLHR